MDGASPFSVRYDLAVVFGVALAVGLLTSGDEKNRIWWMPAASARLFWSCFAGLCI